MSGDLERLDAAVGSIGEWKAARLAEQRKTAPSCPECGTNLADAGKALCQRPVYCSNACRQRAYRKRVTANESRAAHLTIDEEVQP